jgi:hypothetical protein
MPKRIKQKRSTDVNQIAYNLVELSTQENPSDVVPATSAQISLVMAELGRRGGKIGGKRRLKTMTANERKAVARKAARARWKKKAK